MKYLVRAALLTAMLLIMVRTSEAQVSVGIFIGTPPPAPVAALVPASPYPGSVWVEGYWYPVGKHYKWHEGYWTRPPYEGAHWMAPHYEGNHYYVGYWQGERGRVEHDHHWDHDRDRDYHHDHGRHGDHDRDEQR